MLEIERYTDTPEQREKNLQVFEADMRRSQGSYDRSGLPGQNPTFRIRIHTKKGEG